MPSDPRRSNADTDSSRDSETGDSRAVEAQSLALGDDPARPAAAEPEDEFETGASLVGQIIADRYQVVELLGRGGMGAVYRADHVVIKKSFALKVLHPELTHQSEAVRRFEREAIAAARIDHPNVATAIDFGNLPTGEFYLILDYVQGKSLRSVLHTETTLPESRTVRIARQIASGLAAAHAANIVHRDLKPDNVMLVDASTEADFAKVLDFGIAKLRTEEIADEPAITRFGTVFGTPEYMSPEQALGQSVDPRSDLYSLGIMMYEMLSGRTPFADEQLVTVLSRHMTDLPAPLDQVTPELAKIIDKLLEKRPENRYASAEALSLALDQLPASILTTSLKGMPSSVHLEALATNETVLAFDDQPGAKLARGRDLLGGSNADLSPQYSMPPWLKRQVTVAGRPLPWVILAIVAGLVAVTVVVTLTVGSILSGPQSIDSASVAEHPSAVQPAETLAQRQLAQWLIAATNGDAEALKSLESRAATENSASVWAAIGAGRMHARRHLAATEAYEKAFARDAKVTATPQTKSDLYQAALVNESSELSVRLALTYLGPDGADLLYAVYEASAVPKTQKLDRKKLRTWIDSPEFKKNASPGLLVALDLSRARNCQEYRNLLARAKTNGDERSLPSLRKLSYDRGCGILGLGDCYSCLRGTRQLADAIEAAKSRPSPHF